MALNLYENYPKIKLTQLDNRYVHVRKLINLCERIRSMKQMSEKFKTKLIYPQHEKLSKSHI